MHHLQGQGPLMLLEWLSRSERDQAGPSVWHNGHSRSSARSDSHRTLCALSDCSEEARADKTHRSEAFRSTRLSKRQKQQRNEWKKHPGLISLNMCKMKYSPRGPTYAFAPSFYCTSYTLPVRHDENETTNSILEVGDCNDE